jgi:hypothetical protein
MKNVNTDKYEAAYSKKPRGYGAWFFCVERRPEETGVSNSRSFTGTYAEARKQAIAHFGNQRTIYVMP